MGLGLGVEALDGDGLTFKMALTIGATFGGHPIVPSVNENHVIDWFRAVVIICLATKL